MYLRCTLSLKDETLPHLGELLNAWAEQGYQCISMGQYFANLRDQELPVHDPLG